MKNIFVKDLKDIALFLAYIVIGLVIIFVVCIIIMPRDKGYIAGLVIAAVAMFWAVLGGVSLLISSFIKSLRSKD